MKTNGAPNHNQTAPLRVKSSVKAGGICCNYGAPNHNQTVRPAATGLKLKTSLKAGFKSCRNLAECGDSNHNQTAFRSR